MVGIAEVTYGPDGRTRSSSPSASSRARTSTTTSTSPPRAAPAWSPPSAACWTPRSTLNLAMLTLMQKNLQGTIFGGGNPHYDIPQLLSMYKAGKLNLDDMVTRQYRSSRSTTATRTCWTAGTSAASSATPTRTGRAEMTDTGTVEQSPVVAASQASWRCVQSGDKEGWLALMADDVVIEDPIGEAVTNPDGNGVRGKEAVAEFFDANIGPQPVADHLRRDVPVEQPDRDRLHPGAARRRSRTVRRHGARGVHLPGRRRRADHQPARLLEHGRDDVHGVDCD